VRNLLNHTDELVINVDALTYAGTLDSLADFKDFPRHVFVQGNILDQSLMSSLLQKYQPHAIMHLAAESHVDRSITGPEAFLMTNVLGTFRLLESARQYFLTLGAEAQKRFRFLHISTDEVYGSLSKDDAPFSELNRYEPNSPYSASKASSDHFVRAYFHTYGLPVVTTNCSNNYGPYQFPEKLLPLCISNALAGKPLPIYGDGQQVRDWLYVEDHVEALKLVLSQGQLGETYNVGGLNEQVNLNVVQTLCKVLDELRPRKDQQSYSQLIQFVKDRPGHDRRYAIDARKITSTLGWKPQESFETGLYKTVSWYLENMTWVNERLK
jgi:dTDP-glucose 4,6-dehydratase